MTRTQQQFGMPLLLLLAGLAGAEVPLGHKDFYPSPARPIGFRGDGNGYFPGATPVTTWREGTGATMKNHNIVWKTEMPSWANTQPIVVGDRVFTTAEPNTLVCVDARTGKIFWTASANPWELIGVPKTQADKVQAMYDIWREAIPHFDKMRGNGTMSRRVPSSEFALIGEAFVQKGIPRIVKALNELDPEGKYDEAAKVTAGAVKKYGEVLAKAEKKAGPYSGKHDPLNRQLTRLQETLGNRIKAYSGQSRSGKSRTQKIPLEVPWGHLVGFCMPTPVCDGQYVYASFGQGQTVCYDLNGKRIWAVHHTPNPQKDDLSGVMTPLLVGNVLVDMHGGSKVVRGLDKHTGKLLWEAPTKGEGVPEGGGYFVGSHKMVRLNSEGKPMDVIVTSLCNILRASDGRRLGSLPFAYPPSGGPSIVCSGDIVLKGATGDNYSTPYVAYRLKRVSDDKVEATEIWRTRRTSTPGYQAVALTPSVLLMASREHTALDPATGKVLLRSRGGASEIAGFSNLVAGNFFLWAEDGSRSWGSRGEEVFGTFGTADVTDPAKIKVISNKNVLGGINKPRVAALEKYAPELYAMKFYTGNAFGWPAHFLHADTAIFPSGNRLFIRSASHLYCIGDPKIPFDWNRVSRPTSTNRTLDDRLTNSPPGEGSVSSNRSLARRANLRNVHPAATRGEADRPNAPDPSKGTKLRNGYTRCKFVTRAIKDGKEVDVPYEADYWLPPGYETETTRRYPVIYVLQNMDLPRKEMAELFRKGQFPPFLVVHIGGITQPLNKGESGVWSDSLGPSGTIFRTQLTAWVEKHFRCVPGARGRVLIGCSKAGGGVMHLGLNYPDLFSALVSADGAMGLYDVGNKEGGYYEKNKMRFLDAIARKGDASKNLPALMLLGSMFGIAGENDAYLKRLRAAGMRDLEFQDCRHHGHDCDIMTRACFPEVMATFYNGIGDFAPWKPTVSQRGTVSPGPLTVTVGLAKSNWTIRYTLDGSDPHKAGKIATGPILVEKTGWLRVIGLSPDGKKQSRETLARYTIQLLKAGDSLKNPGLTARAFTGINQKRPENDLAAILKGEKNPVVEAVVAAPGDTAALLAQLNGKITKQGVTLVYTGAIQVPETRTYEFELGGHGMLFVPESGKSLKESGHRSYGAARLSLPLEKGSHAIVLIQPVGSKPTMKLFFRQSNGTTEAVPVAWYRH